VLVLVCVLAAFWPSRPERILLLAPLSETKGEQGMQHLREQLAACGPDAVAPILKTIQRHNPWDRDWLKQLPLALHDLGEPAHRALLEDLDTRPHSLERTGLMAALQLGFSDYSRFELWLTNAMGEVQHGMQVSLHRKSATTFQMPPHAWFSDSLWLEPAVP
jgi:hypothetical protein